MDEEHGNPLVRDVLTCYEREMSASSDDRFPAGAGGPSGVPIMDWDSAGARTSTEGGDEMDDRDGAATEDAGGPDRPMPPLRPPRQQAPGEARTLGTGGRGLEAVTSVHETGTDAVLQANSLENLVVAVALPRQGGAAMPV